MRIFVLKEPNLLPYIMMKPFLTSLLAGLLLCGCAHESTSIVIVPHPNNLEVGRGSFAVSGSSFVVDSRADERTAQAVEEFAAQLAAVAGGEYPVTVAEAPATGDVHFVVDTTVAREGYRLDITKRGVEVRASEFPGFFYALQSIKQLLPAAVYGTEPAPDAAWKLPCVRIDDAPRFGYRGMHLDVARHFFSVEEVKRYIDMMAVHKCNTLHWHLTDDQGWRIEIKRYPRLTEVGSVRKGTMIRKEWGSNDGIPYGGFYTQEEIRDIVAYAAARAITVVPEIDLPGHMLAAMTAYPELGCTGGPYEVWVRWGVADDVLCVGREQTFEFIENVLTEVMELFPSEYIHIGGDECPKVRWEHCPRCQARIRALGLKDANGHKAEHYLQSYVTARVEKFLGEHGRRIIGWDEILEGELAPNATVMSWRGSEGGIAAAKLGHDVIMTPNSHFYFDYYQSLDTENEPFGIGGYLPVERVYSFDPMDRLTPEQQQHILGVQANLWTEYIADNAHLEYMLLPRLSALSEVQWCQPEIRDWERFLGEFRMEEIYNAMGFNFAKHIFGVSGSYVADPEKQCVVVTLKTQGDTPIYYTLDGSTPTTASACYEGPIEVRESGTLRAAALREDMETAEYSKTFVLSKSSCRPIVLNSAPTPKYTYGAPMSLVDGFHGAPGYTNGAWVGYLEEPMDVTIDMQGAGAYSKVVVESLVDKGEWIFPPAAIEVLTSEDGAEFTPIAKFAVPEEQAESANGVKSFTVEFPETEARYLRVVARTVNPIPDWHGARGHKAHMFIGEIAVE